MAILTALTAPPAGGVPPKQLVFLLHGLGDSGYGLLPLSQYWRLQLPEALFVAPHAPQRCEGVPPEYEHSYQWFSLRDWQPGNFDPFGMTGLVAGAAPALIETIQHYQQLHNLTPAQTALVGFSQGCMMALYVGARFTPPLGAIVGYSGALVGSENLATEMVAHPPILLVHGQLDEVVPYAAMPAAAMTLSGFGFQVETLSRPLLGHSLDDEGVARAGSFLHQHIFG